MYTRNYFIFSLALPLGILALGSIIMLLVTNASSQLVANIVVPYFCFSVALVVWSLRHTPKAIRILAYRTPILFLLFEFAYILLEYYADVSIAKNMVGLIGLMMVLSTYIVVLGYLYVFLMELGYFSYIYQKRHHGYKKRHNDRRFFS